MSLAAMQPRPWICLLNRSFFSAGHSLFTHFIELAIFLGHPFPVCFICLVWVFCWFCLFLFFFVGVLVLVWLGWFGFVFCFILVSYTSEFCITTSNVMSLAKCLTDLSQCHITSAIWWKVLSCDKCEWMQFLWSIWGIWPQCRKFYCLCEALHRILYRKELEVNFFQMKHLYLKQSKTN